MQLPQNCQLVWTETAQNGSKWCRSYLFPSQSHVFSWPNDRCLLLQVSMSPEGSPEDFIPCQPAQIGWFKQSVSGWFTRQKCRFGTNRSPFFMGYCRRKFRSQTSDNMDRWKAEQGRGREKRKIRREKIREEKESEERRCRCAKR